MILRASHTTMTYTLFNAIWNLAAHADFQERIAAQNPTDPITHQIIQETMRLTPPISAVPKQAEKEITVDDSYKIRKGDTVVISPYITGKDGRFYERPSKFDPERHFSAEAVTSRHRDAFIPYGVGPRKCPGRGMAEQELSMILTKICANFEFTRATSAEPAADATFLMLPDRSSRIAIQPRATMAA